MATLVLRREPLVGAESYALRHTNENEYALPPLCLL